jgi:hypothetical protein
MVLTAFPTFLEVKGARFKAIAEYSNVLIGRYGMHSHTHSAFMESHEIARFHILPFRFNGVGIIDTETEETF